MVLLFNRFSEDCETGNIYLMKLLLRSQSRKEPHHLVGAGAVSRCGSGSDGSGS
jgi:hypothetical protein